MYQGIITWLLNLLIQIHKFGFWANGILFWDFVHFVLPSLFIKGLTQYGYDRFGFTPAGFDKDGCDFLYRGPFDVLQSLKIWELLFLQDKGFLMSVYRLCPALDPVPLSWSRQFWAPTLKDVSGNTPVQLRQSVETLKIQWLVDTSKCTLEFWLSVEICA